jgi:hypothetical protein
MIIAPRQTLAHDVRSNSSAVQLFGGVCTVVPFREWQAGWPARDSTAV